MKFSMKDYTNKTINANCLQGLQTLTGKLTFEKDGFIYKADSVNGAVNKGKILYADILKVNKKNTFGLIPNGLSIILKNHTEIVYVINCRNEVFNYLVSRNTIQ